MPETRRFAPTALMIGNFVVGIGLLAPTAMLPELSVGLGVSIREAGLLVTFGAVVLCVGSPVMGWLTSRIERRLLLTGTVAIVAAANLASTLAPNYATLLAVRLAMCVVAALYTPQAAAAVGLMVPPQRRGGYVAFVFLGWTLAVAVGLPLVTLIATRLGWREVHALIGGAGAVSVALLAWRLPRGLYGAPVDLGTWVALSRNRLVLLLLAITTLQIAGQFSIFTFMAPLLSQLTGAGSDATGLLFALYGLAGLCGIVTASRIVDGWGGFKSSALATGLVLTGMTIWSFGAGSYAVMAVAVMVWGLGFGAINSMQQVRLIAAAPAFGAASVSLNTSMLYVGQAIGSGIGGQLYAGGQFHASGFVAMGFETAALLAVIASRRFVPAISRRSGSGAPGS